LRLEALKELGETETLCLIATDDEAFTYNNRINRLAIIQEHKMILKAIERGVSEDHTNRVVLRYIVIRIFWKQDAPCRRSSPFNNRRLLEPIGNIQPAEAEEHYYATLDQPAMAA
jgi:hypothetical protein